MILNDVRGLVQDSAFARPLGPGRCGRWTPAHVTAIRTQSLGPWLYQTLRSEPQADVPPEILAELHHDYMVSGLAALARERPLKKLLAAFEADRLPVILLKGMYLGCRVYEEPALRPMGDLDLLVWEDAFEQANRVLISSGYAVAVEDTDMRHETLNRARVYTKAGTHSVEIDLHRAVWSMDYYRIPASVIWSDAGKSMLYGHRAYFLSPELNFLHLGIHNLNHVGGIRDWLDLVLLLHRGRFDWDRFLHLADSTCLMRPMHHVFQELASGWGYVPPTYVRRALAGYRPHWLEDRVIRARFRYPWRLFSRLRLIPGWKPRFEYLRNKALRPRLNCEASSGVLERLAYIGARWNLLVHFWKRGR